MGSLRKKENIEDVKKRVAKFRNKPDFDSVQITNISHLLKLEFLSLPGDTYAEKLIAALEAWKKLNRKPDGKYTISGPITSSAITSGMSDYKEPDYEIQPSNKAGDLLKGKVSKPVLPPARFTKPKKI